MRPLVRVALVCLLVAFVGWQLTDYAVRMDDRLVYPTDGELTDDFAAYHGQEVDVWLTVASRNGDSFRSARGWTVTADSLPASLDPGDSVQVYGIARPGPSIEARRVVVTDATNRQYLYGISALALLLAVGLTLRHWRPSLRDLTVRPRDREPPAPTGADAGPDSTAPEDPSGGDAGE
jgi:hypothetical protein